MKRDIDARRSGAARDTRSFSFRALLAAQFAMMEMTICFREWGNGVVGKYYMRGKENCLFYGNGNFGIGETVMIRPYRNTWFLRLSMMDC